MSWINETGPDRDVVMSSRVRIARNIADIPFPSIRSAACSPGCRKGQKLSAGSEIRFCFDFMYMQDVPAIERQILVEKHLASRDLMKRYEQSALIMDSREKITVMINEERSHPYALHTSAFSSILPGSR